MPSFTLKYEALYTFDQWGQYLFGAYSAYAKGLDLDECSFDQCNVLSDITGVTGMKIIRAIVSGERNRKVLASYRDAKCAKSEEEIEKSLEGNYKLEHLFVLKQALELYDFYDQQIKQCDQELETLYNEFEEPDQPGTPTSEKRKRKRRKNQPHFDLSESLYRMAGGIDLTKIEGLDTLTVQEVLSETGTDMRKWRTVKHFCSWLCLAPNNKITGGKVKSSHTPHTKNRASNAFRIAAQSLMKSKSALGAYCRRMAALHDAPTALPPRLTSWQKYFTLCSNVAKRIALWLLIIMKKSIVTKSFVLYNAEPPLWAFAWRPSPASFLGATVGSKESLPPNTRLLATKDVLVCVMDKRQEFMWVHERFVGEY